MLYLISEYASEYPYRSLQGLEKFKDCQKYLHKMSFAEINEYVSHWSPLLKRTAINQKRQILYYLQWLQTKGVSTDISRVMDIEIPITEKQFLIYSTKHLDYYYNILFDYLQERAKQNDVEFSKSVYYMCYAAGILSFYGLTEEQIIKLKLYDITSSGVNGYNLPLTKKDIDILMTYRNTQRLANRMPLCGDNYIRSIHKNTKITSSFLSRPLWRIEFDEEHSYLQKLLTINNLYWLGVYARAYEHEDINGIEIIKNQKTPSWFCNLIGSHNGGTLSIRKSEYLEYKTERDTYSDYFNSKIENENSAEKNIESKLNENQIICTNDYHEIKSDETKLEESNNQVLSIYESYKTPKNIKDNIKDFMKNLENSDSTSVHMLTGMIKILTEQMASMENELNELKKNSK